MAQAFALRVGGVLLSIAVASFAARSLLPEKYGQFAWIMSLVALLTFPTTSGLRSLVTRETAYLHSDGPASRSYGLWNWSLNWSILFSLVAALLVLVFAIFLGIGDLSSTDLLLCIALIFLSPVSKVFSGALQGLGRVITSQITEVVIRPTLMLLMLIPVIIFIEPGALPVSIYLVGYCAASLGEVLFGARFLGFLRLSVVRKVRKARLDLDKRSLMIAALSFGGIGGIQVANANLDVLMLGVLSDSTAAGLFRSATTLAALVSFGLVVINIVTMSHFARIYKEESTHKLQSMLINSSRIVLAVAAVGFVFLALFGKTLLGLLFGVEFVGANSALIVLSTGQLASAFFGPVALVMNMTGNERVTLYSSLWSLAANVVLNVTLIPIWGATGAAVATAVSLLVWSVFLSLTLKSRTGLRCTLV